MAIVSQLCISFPYVLHGLCEDYLTCDIAFNAVMPLSRAPTRGRYSRIEGITDLHAIKYLPLKLKGPARHWLKSLPENSIGSWEELEDAFRANFQGTYVRPPDADDLSHITQQPGESSRKLWNRFLTKKNQIVDCPDAEALAAFKHNIRDKWLARHLARKNPSPWQLSQH